MLTVWDYTFYPSDLPEETTQRIQHFIKKLFIKERDAIQKSKHSRHDLQCRFHILSSCVDLLVWSAGDDSGKERENFLFISLFLHLNLKTPSLSYVIKLYLAWNWLAHDVANGDWNTHVKHARKNMHVTNSKKGNKHACLHKIC